MQSFDLEALVRACLISLCVAILGRYIVHLATRGKTPEKESQRLLMLATAAAFVLVAIGIYYAWPSLPTVPVLDKLSQAEAESRLLSHKLVPQPRPQTSTEVPAGVVLPHSQDPPAGITVHPGTVVTFGVSVSHPVPDHGDGNTGGSPSIKLFQPRSGEALRCTIEGDGICRGSVSGTSAGIGQQAHLLLWLKPVRPPSDQFGWYLERSGNGITRVERDGSWVGTVQVGNAQYPPHENDIVDIAVSLADESTFRELMGRGGVVVEPQPIGTAIDTSSNVVLTLK